MHFKTWQSVVYFGRKRTIAQTRERVKFYNTYLYESNTENSSRAGTLEFCGTKKAIKVTDPEKT
jgi:hypothetical protein